MASAMPVLPEVESRIVFPGTSRPRASPSSIILRAGRSFTEPPGLKPSSLPSMRMAALAASRDRRDDRQLVARLERRLEVLQEADVLAVDEDVHETPHLSGLVTDAAFQIGRAH